MQAGVCRRSAGSRCAAHCFPRASGGVPNIVAPLPAASAFSPCKRGCADDRARRRNAAPVFPVQAGVCRHRAQGRVRRFGFPRASGGVPILFGQSRRQVWFSPCKRGCAGRAIPAARGLPVFPVQAGVCRSRIPPDSPGQRFPRASGGVPTPAAVTCARSVFSPCKRGCADPFGRRARRAGVFPVQAGVCRLCRQKMSRCWSFPRASGGVPTPAAVTCARSVFPRASGGVPAPNPVACRVQWFSPCKRGCAVGTYGVGGRRAFSPCKRGCAAAASEQGDVKEVFPVQAGVSRQMLRPGPPRPGFPAQAGVSHRPRRGRSPLNAGSSRERGRPRL